MTQPMPPISDAIKKNIAMSANCRLASLLTVVRNESIVTGQSEL